MDYQLTTKEKVKTLLGITGTTQDALINMLILQTSSYIEGEISQRLLETAYEELINGGLISERPRTYLVLKAFPVTDFTKLETKGGTETSPNWIDIDANYYTRNDRNGTLFAQQGFLRGFLNYKVTYSAGYLIDFANETDPTKHTLPFDLTMVATEITALKYSTRNSMGLVSESTEGQSVTYTKAGSGGVSSQLTKEQREVVDRYSRHPIV